jgi:hypothetical protein
VRAWPSPASPGRKYHELSKALEVLSRTEFVSHWLLDVAYLCFIIICMFAFMFGIDFGCSYSRSDGEPRRTFLLLYESSYATEMSALPPECPCSWFPH